jgi:hypothetical protein
MRPRAERPIAWQEPEAGSDMANDQIALICRTFTVDPVSHQFLHKSRLNNTLRRRDRLPLRIVPV